MTTSDDENGEYRVGYGKPPREHQFKKGEPQEFRRRRSQKISKTRIERLAAIGQEKVTIVENGRKRKTSKADAIDRFFVNDALRGDPKARAEWFKQTQAMDKIASETLANDEFHGDPRAVLMAKIEKMAARSAASQDEPTAEASGKNP